MNTNYVYLKVPDAEALLAFMIDRRIHTYAAVVNRTWKQNQTTLTYRLTAKDESAQEIAVCDILIWKGLKFDLPDNINPMKDAKVKEVEAILQSGKIGESPYQVSHIDGEYTLEA